MNATTREWWYRGISAGLALGAHGLLLGGGLLWWPVQEVATDTAMSVVMVDLDIAAPSAPPAEPPPAPPQPLLLRRQATSQPMPPPAPPPNEAALEQIAPVLEYAEASTLEPAPETPPDADNAFLLQTDTTPTSPPQQAVSSPLPQAVMSWQQQLLTHLQHHRRYPGQARHLRQEGIAHVRFSVDRQGRVSHPHIERASGHRLLDEETLATVHRANPVPPPPMEVTGNPVDVVVPVSFHLHRR